jgi:DNA-binding protein H-NS
VPKRLGMSTVVAWFGTLSFDQQKGALGKINELHEQSRSAKRAELEAQLAALGYGGLKRRGRPRKSVASSGNDRAAKRGRTGKVKAKYRDSRTNETWSGRGRMASWLKAKQDDGEKIDKYLV